MRWRGRKKEVEKKGEVVLKMTFHSWLLEMLDGQSFVKQTVLSLLMSFINDRFQEVYRNTLQRDPFAISYHFFEKYLEPTSSINTR